MANLISRMDNLQLEIILKAISYSKRLQIIRHLIKYGECDIERIARSIKVPYDTAFRNLSILRGAGFIVSRTSSARILFKINPLASSEVKILIKIISNHA